MNPFTRHRTTRRAHEWTKAKVVTFTVTLAETRNVTAAAMAAGMSRKSAYGLKARNSAFSAAWEKAIGRRQPCREGSHPNLAAGSTESTSLRAQEEALRELYLARIAAGGRRGRLAPPPRLP